MSLIRCEEHDCFWDSDFDEKCRKCEWKEEDAKTTVNGAYTNSEVKDEN